MLSILKSFPTCAVRDIWLSLGLFLGVLLLSEDARAYCGPLTVAETYEIKGYGRTFTMPKFGVIQYRGNTIYTDQDGESIRTQYYTKRKTGWFHPEMGVLAHADRNFVYVVQYFQDCRGASGAKLVVLSWDGQFLAESWVPANGQFDGFFYLGAALTYWNESFCVNTQSGNEAPHSTIIIFDPGTARFGTAVVPYTDYCSAGAMREFEKKRFLFTQLTPENPVYTATR